MTVCANGPAVRFTHTIKSRAAPTAKLNQMGVRAKANWNWHSFMATAFTPYLARAPVSSTASTALAVHSFRIGSAPRSFFNPQHSIQYLNIGNVPLTSVTLRDTSEVCYAIMDPHTRAQWLGSSLLSHCGGGDQFKNLCPTRNYRVGD